MASNGDVFDSVMDAITTRIQKVQLAKGLIARGAFPEALRVLRTVRDPYDDPSMVKAIDWLIRETEEQAGGA